MISKGGFGCVWFVVLSGSLGVHLRSGDGD